MNSAMEALGKKASSIREIFEYANKRKAEIGAENVFDFSLGNPATPPPKKVRDTLETLLSETDPLELHGYTSAAGIMSVREKIAAAITENYSFPAKAGNIYITCGAAASLTISLKALLDSGDEVILVAPFFPEYTVFVENAGGVPVIVKSDKPDFQPDFEALAAAVNEKTRAIIINSPNNPSGAILSEKTLEKLAALLSEKEKQFGKEIFIISDEPYRELAYEGAKVPWVPDFYEKTLVCYSYSKALSLPGERIGWIFVSPKIKNAGDIFAAICGAGRSMGYVCAPSLFQRLIGECVSDKPDMDFYGENRNLLYNGITEAGFEAVKPEGAFYIFMKSPEPDAKAFCERAKKFELLFVPGDDFGFEGYVRIAYCVPKERIEKAIPKLRLLHETYKEKNI